MRVLITGTGRGGTNLLAALVRCFPDFNFDQQTEDRSFLQRKLPANYGAKLVVEHPVFTFKNLKRALGKYEDLKIIMSIRHPVDICLSKIVRGQPTETTPYTYNPLEIPAPDSTLNGSIRCVKFMFKFRNFMISNYEDRFMEIKMDSIVLDLEKSSKRIKSFLGFPQDPNLNLFFKNHKNKHHQNAYRQKMDITQLNLRDDYENIFGGFFKDKDYLLQINEAVSEMIKEWEY